MIEPVSPSESSNKRGRFPLIVWLYRLAIGLGVAVMFLLTPVFLLGWIMSSPGGFGGSLPNADRESVEQLFLAFGCLALAFSGIWVLSRDRTFLFIAAASLSIGLLLPLSELA